MKVGQNENPGQTAGSQGTRTFDEIFAEHSRRPSAPARPAPQAAGIPLRSAPGPTSSAAGQKLIAPAKRQAMGGMELLARRVGRTQLTEKHAAASAATEKVLGAAHRSAAAASRERQAERVENTLRASLFRELEHQSGASAQHRSLASPCAQRPGDSRLLPPPPETPACGAAEPGMTARPESTSPARTALTAEALSALVERIEAAVKDGRPTLSLGLGEKAAAGSVDIQRSARGEVCVRINARGPARQRLLEASHELKAALAARGLRVRSLEIG